MSSRMCQCSAACLSVVLVLSFGQTAYGQGAEQGSGNQAATPITLTASGAISLGSYQGGIDWAVTEFLRRQVGNHADNRFRKALGLGPDERWELRAATGASAGNVDALFGALSWCTGGLNRSLRPANTLLDPISIQDSLFWKAWINTGISEVMPAKPQELAMFDRDFFETKHKDTIKEFRTKGWARDGCDVPLGLTLTRLDPIQVELVENSGVTATVQRFATVFRVATVGDQVEFKRAEGWVDHRSLGALAQLVGLEAQKSWDEQLDTVFKAVLASSSFPGAFAPKDLTYRPAGLTARGPREVTNAEFVDGGVFDNQPLGLAYELHERCPSASGCHPKAPVVAFASPGSYRGALANAGEKASRARSGLGAVFTLLGGAIPAARQYELQAFARGLAHDGIRSGSAPSRTPTIKISTRAFATVGETLSSFGGFLGRPFREHDFYLGVYDGMLLVANILCQPQPDSKCANETLGQIVHDDVFGIGGIGIDMIRWFKCREFASACDPRPQPAGTALTEDQRHLNLLMAIARALPSPADSDKRIGCKSGGDLVVNAMCNGGLDAMLQTLSNDDAVRSYVEQLAKECDTQKQTEQYACLADRKFAALLAHPRQQVYLSFVAALTNLERAEAVINKKHPGTSKSSLIEKGFLLFGPATYRYRTKVTFMGSSARPDYSSFGEGLWTVLTRAVPNSFEWRDSRKNQHQFSFGWRAVAWNINDHVFIAAPVDLALHNLPESSRRNFFADHTSVSLSLGSYSVRGFTSIEGGVTWTSGVLAAEQSPGHHVAGRLAARLLSDKIQVSLVGRTGDHRFLTWTIGLSDISGTFYWLTR